jgi:hypothetical protein
MRQLSLTRQVNPYILNASLAPGPALLKDGPRGPPLRGRGTRSLTKAGSRAPIPSRRKEVEQRTFLMSEKGGLRSLVYATGGVSWMTLRLPPARHLT